MGCLVMLIGAAALMAIAVVAGLLGTDNPDDGPVGFLVDCSASPTDGRDITGAFLDEAFELGLVDQTDLFIESADVARLGDRSEPGFLVRFVEEVVEPAGCDAERLTP